MIFQHRIRRSNLVIVPEKFCIGHGANCPGRILAKPIIAPRSLLKNKCFEEADWEISSRYCISVPNHPFNQHLSVYCVPGTITGAWKDLASAFIFFMSYICENGGSERFCSLPKAVLLKSVGDNPNGSPSDSPNTKFLPIPFCIKWSEKKLEGSVYLWTQKKIWQKGLFLENCTNHFRDSFPPSPYAQLHKDPLPPGKRTLLNMVGISALCYLAGHRVLLRRALNWW